MLTNTKLWLHKNNFFVKCQWNVFVFSLRSCSSLFEIEVFLTEYWSKLINCPDPLCIEWFRKCEFVLQLDQLFCCMPSPSSSSLSITETTPFFPAMISLWWYVFEIYVVCVTNDSFILIRVTISGNRFNCIY